jgi:predicted ABC-type ATPase
MSKDGLRLRLFAGPNGSGKSTIKHYVIEVLGIDSMGIVIDPDEIELAMSKTNRFNFTDFGVTISQADIIHELTNSQLLHGQAMQAGIESLRIEDSVIWFDNANSNPYYAAALSDIIRNRLVLNRKSFSFESVMSHYSKVDLLKYAQASGYRTYLYFVATDDVEINIERVKNRVNEGGHSVPIDKIRERYVRSISLLREAIRYTNRTYIFDNTGSESMKMAEINEGKEMVLHSYIRPWFAATYRYLTGS